MTWDDQPLPEDAAIAAAHPTITNRHDIYAEAMRLVGARHSKGALVELVNWLLAQRAALIDALDDCLKDLIAERDSYYDSITDCDGNITDPADGEILAEIDARLDQCNAIMAMVRGE